MIAGVLGGLLVIGGLAALGSVLNDPTGTFGLPKDFPVYPNATLVGIHENFTPGKTRVDASWEADASLDAVTRFYAEQLTQGPWQITQRDAVSGIWEFRRTDGKTRGLIKLSGHGQQTRVDVSLLK